MIAVYKYFKGYHVEEQLELFYTSQKSETKTSGGKTSGRQIFNSIKGQSILIVKATQGWNGLTVGSSLHIPGCSNA